MKYADMQEVEGGHGEGSREGGRTGGCESGGRGAEAKRGRKTPHQRLFF